MIGEYDIIDDSNNDDLPLNVMEGYTESPSESDADGTDYELPDSNDESDIKAPAKRAFILPPHISINQGEFPTYTCSLCYCRFFDRKNAKYHEYCVNGKRPYKCRLCGKRYVKRDYLNQHLKTHTGEKSYQCKFCAKAFHIKHKLYRHERSHTGKKGAIACLKCEQTFLTKDALTKHEVRKHSAESVFTCTSCKKAFVEEAVYLNHIKTHSATKVFICEHCGKTFNKCWNLNVHKRIHLGLKPYSCEICKLTFRVPQHLERHCLRHRPDPNFECAMCKTTFRRKDNLLRHMKLNHPGQHVGTIRTQEDRNASRKNVLKRSNNKIEAEDVNVELHTRFPHIRFAKKLSMESSNNVTDPNSPNVSTYPEAACSETLETDSNSVHATRNSVIKFIEKHATGSLEKM